jgi:hypothetical protein
MHDNIHQVVAQLEKRGVEIAVGCSHVGWQISTVNGEEIVRYVSAREVLSFLSGVLCATTMAKQLNA